MINDYAAFNSFELWNHARLAAYLQNVGSPFDTGAVICSCDTLTAEVIGNGPYTTPSGSMPAPWYDADVPESADFLGMLVLRVEGVDDNPRARSVSGAVGGGGVFGPTRVLPRTITVTGVLIGSTCCGAQYGLNYMSQVLSSCAEGGCDGECMQMYACCPAPGMTSEEFNRRHRRTFRRTALVEGPVVTRRRGLGSCEGTCGNSGELIEIEFTIVASNPWAWTDAREVLDVGFPVGGEGDCIEWCVAIPGELCDGEQCLHRDCNPNAGCAQDPLVTFMPPPEPTTPTSAFCTSLAPETACYTIDLTDQPRWAEDVPVIEINSGSEELRNVRISFYVKSDPAADCGAQQDDFTCEPTIDFLITYMPANSVMTIDGQTGASYLDCGNGCEPATTVFGDTDGGPVRINGLTCSLYCVCLSVDNANPVAPDASFSLELTQRGL